MPVKDYARMLRIFTIIVQDDRQFAAEALRPNPLTLAYEDWLLETLHPDQAGDTSPEWRWEWYGTVVTYRATEALMQACRALSNDDSATAAQHKELSDRLYSLRRMMISVERNATPINPAALPEPADGPVSADSPRPGAAGADVEL